MLLEGIHCSEFLAWATQGLEIGPTFTVLIDTSTDSRGNAYEYTRESAKVCCSRPVEGTKLQDVLTIIDRIVVYHNDQ